MKKIFILILLGFIFVLSKHSFAYSYGVGPIKNNNRPDVGIFKDLVESNGGYYIGPDEKKLYLTFDCGYENGYTEAILDTLKENDVKACFFITGHYLNTSLDIVNRMKNEGHIVGNHTTHHRHFTKSTNEEILEDITSLENNYKEKTGYDLSKFYRPPAGEITKESMSVLNQKGYKCILWSLAYVDWYKDKYNGNHYSYKEVMKKIHNGAIILMHSVSKDNMMDLKDIIVKLKSDGYTFETLEKL